MYILEIHMNLGKIYSDFNYFVTVLTIFITIYYYNGRKYFITIVIKFYNYFRAVVIFNRK